MLDSYFPEDDHPCYLPNGRALDDPARVLSFGELPNAPRVFGTRVRLTDRLGTERTFKFFIPADHIDQARTIARIRKLGEVVTGEVVATYPA